MYSHIPVLCEEREIPYVFTPSRQHLGLAIGFTRPYVVVMIKRNEEYGAAYDEIAEAAKQLDLAVS
jgi:H/ACA ribonucleoprotein complex subunit 2